MKTPGRPLSRPAGEGGRWAHRLALLTCLASVVLILAGGLVTSLGAGLAVPDWPTTFGYNMFLFPWSKMVGGILVEHSHRLLGSLVGTLTILTAAAIGWSDPRRWLRRLAAAALGLVIVQGVLGGMRVVLIKVDLAIVHACVAQLFFGLMVSIALFTSRGWKRAEAGGSEGAGPGLRRLGLATAGAVYAQSIFGAVLRHTGARLDAHLLLAGVVAFLVIWLGVRILRDHPGRRELVRPVNILWFLLVAQVTLGAGSYLAKYTAVGDALPDAAIVTFTSAHVLVGALLFATALVLALRLHRAAAAAPGRVPAGAPLPGEATA